MSRWPIENKNFLEQIRTEAGFSRDKAALSLKISLSTLVRYEKKPGSISIELASRMADLYKVPFDNIVNAIKNNLS